MPTTPNRGYVTPAFTDAPNVPTHLQALANQIDADIALLFADTGWRSTGVVGLNAAGNTSGSGVATIVQQNTRLIFGGLIAWVNLVVQLNAAISVGADGNTPNTYIAQMPSDMVPNNPPFQSQGLTQGPGGPLTGFDVTGLGQLVLASTTAAADLSSGAQVTVSGCYLR